MALLYPIVWKLTLVKLEAAIKFNLSFKLWNSRKTNDLDSHISLYYSMLLKHCVRLLKNQLNGPQFT